MLERIALLMQSGVVISDPTLVAFREIEKIASWVRYAAFQYTRDHQPAILSKISAALRRIHEMEREIYPVLIFALPKG
jgi:hypothetical protein